jgi:hypothetical protein
MSKRQYTLSGHPCWATDINPDAWFYTQQEGLIVCANGCPSCGRQQNSLVIPWRMVKRALAYHETARGRRDALKRVK